MTRPKATNKVARTEVTSVLDGSLYFLGQTQPHILDVALLRQGNTKAVLLFSQKALAAQHLGALSAVMPAGITVQAAHDLRTKEELLRAALARGADTLWLNTPPGGEPAARYPLQRALEYVLSFKRQSACL